MGGVSYGEPQAACNLHGCLYTLLLACLVLVASAVDASVSAKGLRDRRGRRMASVEYFLDTGATTNGAGTSASDPFNNADYAIHALLPGDTLYLMGTVTNPSYDPEFKNTWNGGINNKHLWHAENTLNLRYIKGTSEARITIKPAPNTAAVVRGDGANIIRLHGCEYLTIEGLNVYGEVDNIPLSTAKKLQFVYRDLKSADPLKSKFRVDKTFSTKYNDTENLNLSDDLMDQLEGLKIFDSGDVARPSYTDTRGIYISSSYHVTVQGCEVHHMPGGGIRVSESEYVDVIDNEVHNVARKSYSGTHGIVATKTMDVKGGAKTGQNKYRLRILGNKVHHNYNEIYSWAPTKSKIHPKIDEGKGISLQRNQKFQYGGRILVANNVAYYNGYSGIHSNDGDNIDFFSNTAYMNSYTVAVTYQYAAAANNVGISISDGTDCKVGNNIAVVDSDTGGFAISMTNSSTGTADVNTNIVWGVGTALLKRDADLDGVEKNTIPEDPMFVNPPGSPEDTLYDFAPMSESPAIGAGKPRYSFEVDFFGDLRDENNPTIGAIEYSPGCRTDGQSCGSSEDCCSSLICLGGAHCTSG